MCLAPWDRNLRNGSRGGADKSAKFIDRRRRSGTHRGVLNDFLDTREELQAVPLDGTTRFRGC